MPISEDPSTFEFCREWLLSSDLFLREAMGIDFEDLDSARDAARPRIYREEAYDKPEEEAESETAPDLPPPVDDRPRAIVITRGSERTRVGTATWGGTGQLLVVLEVPIPEEYLINTADDTTDEQATDFAAIREWADRLSTQIRDELLETSGLGAADGTPYLNATDVNLYLTPSFPETEEPQDYMAWVYEVMWK